MKWLIGLFFLPTLAFAWNGTDPEKVCRNATVIQEIELSKFGFSPTNIFVKENDRVCLIFKVVDRSGYKSIRIANYPVLASVNNNKIDVVNFLAKKSGNFKIDCGSYCSFANGQLTVMSSAEYQKMEDEANKWRSINSRQNHYNFSKPYGR